MPDNLLDVRRMVRDHRVIVCCGAGGVGKTTSAAALGVLAAQEGRSAVVMTIDPARRLAQAMGLDALDNDPRPVALDAPGSLAAMMLDNKRTFDRMVETYAPNDRVRETIFANRYYQQLSSTLGGSRELIAMERVLEVVSSDDYDLLVVDTPPAQHALDFLDAPKRLIDLLDGSLTQALVAPYGLAAKAQFNFFRQSSAVTLKFLERLTGLQMLADLSDFLLAFSSMFDGLKERSRNVMGMMTEPTTSFLLVCAPEAVSLGQAAQFAERLDRDSIGISGVLVNRVHLPIANPDPDPQELSSLDSLSSRSVDGLGLSTRVMAALTDARRLASVDGAALEQLSALNQPRRLVPHFNRDLHSMADLEAFAARLA
ncbi:MAG: ArsA-related P-loop ATPase [Pseudomonadales bacterium]|nr:ArsA family ATPase [Pseudomonadales bacterium]